MDEGEVFDANDYFGLLAHLSMEQGYVLDYVSYIEWMGGEPILYARPETEPRYQIFAEFTEATGTTISARSRYDYLNWVQTDGTPGGYLELILLRIMGGQFYLYWHANYNDHQVVCDSAQLQEIVSELRECTGDESDYCLTQKQVRQAKELQVEPVVEFEDDGVRIQVVIFSKWGGFVQQTYTVRQSYPHKVLDRSAEVLVPYDCGIQF
jgi:hypothetical protein